MKSPNSLYVHIPFCRHICAYCDFPKVLYNEAWAKSYLGALFFELEERQIPKGLKTVYLGGGTPTSLCEEGLETLLSRLRPYLDGDYEFSIEANPETLTLEKAKVLFKYGVNRVSIGMQTTSPRLLKLLGRAHEEEDVRRSIALLRSVGISNINVDLMYGLPFESEEELRKDLDAIASFDVPHVSAYSLILEEGTAFYAKGVQPLDDDSQQDQFDIVRDFLEARGWKRYEISNFAKPGYECRHNLTYWRDEPYYAIGLGAGGYVGDTRYVNTKNLQKYLNRDYEGEIEMLSKESMVEDYLLTNLRLVEGFDPSVFLDRFGIDFVESYKEKIEDLSNRGLLIASPTRVKATSRGLDLLDTILRTLF